MPEPLMSTGSVQARSLCGWGERERAVQLYRATFGLADTDPAMTPKLVAALQHNGGSAIGAFDDDELLGFTYGFVGLGQGHVYHYSQAAVVSADHQGRGIGRLLKLAQADLARGSGLTTMRWAYDPMVARNAHFNLDVLGARGRWFHHDYYGEMEVAGHSDRVVVEWDLTADLARVVSAGTANQARPVELAEVDQLPYGEARHTDAGAVLVIPARWSELTRTDPDEASRIRDRVADQLRELFGSGLVLASCRRLDDVRAAYRLLPATDVPATDIGAAEPATGLAAQ